MANYVSYGVKTWWTDKIELDVTRSGEEAAYYIVHLTSNDYDETRVVVRQIGEKGETKRIALPRPESGKFELEFQFEDGGKVVTIYVAGVAYGQVYLSLRITE